MEPQELLLMLRDLESDLIERKASPSDPDRIRQAICAFANDGGPFGQVTCENFGRPGLTDYRNPHLAESMKVLGYVQRFGLGIQIARQQLAANGNPPLVFDVEQNHILATIRRQR